MSDLDNEFEETVAVINDKIKEAADMLKEATGLAKKAGLPGLTYNEYGFYDMEEDEAEEAREKLEKINVAPLEAAMDAAGWQTSSWGC